MMDILENNDAPLWPPTHFNTLNVYHFCHRSSSNEKVDSFTAELGSQEAGHFTRTLFRT